jgi:hypothetical protein
MAPMQLRMEAISFREGWEEKLLLLRGLWNSCGFQRWLLLRGSFINQHNRAQPVSFGAAFRAAIFFPHTVGKIGNTLVTAGNRIVS